MKQNALFVGSHIANELMRTRVLLETAQRLGTEESWENVLAEPDVWSLRHDGEADYSVRYMSDVEIHQSLIEDLLFVAVETHRGSAGSYPISQATRHLGEASEQAVRVEIAIKAMLIVGCVLRNQDDTLVINPTHLKEAQDFCGVYVIDWDIDNSTDVIDDILAVGGRPLLIDALTDAIKSL